MMPVCDTTALCTNFVCACFYDDNAYYGDELKTRAAATANSSSNTLTI